MEKEVKCPNCGNKMICYNNRYYDNREYYLAYCPPNASWGISLYQER